MKIPNQKFAKSFFFFFIFQTNSSKFHEWRRFLHKTAEFYTPIFKFYVCAQKSFNQHSVQLEQDALVRKSVVTWSFLFCFKQHIGTKKGHKQDIKIVTRLLLYTCIMEKMYVGGSLSLLSSLPCFPSFFHSAIPTFKMFFTTFYIHGIV